MSGKQVGLAEEPVIGRVCESAVLVRRCCEAKAGARPSDMIYVVGGETVEGAYLSQQIAPD